MRIYKNTLKENNIYYFSKEFTQNVIINNIFIYNNQFATSNCSFLQTLKKIDFFN